MKAQDATAKTGSRGAPRTRNSGMRASNNRRPATGHDYTPDVLAFLNSAHGKTRVDAKGDYFYDTVSAVSLHFLLQSGIPGPETLWQWYEHFDRGRSESIYQTIPPQRDEELLAILEACRFRWNPEAVRESGLVFLAEHRRQVTFMLNEFISLRLEAYRALDDAALSEELTPRGTWSEQHLARLLARIQTEPLTTGQRQMIYDQLPSGYLRATARHLLDQANHEIFWREPPAELEQLEEELIAFVRQLTAESRRLGVYISKAEFEQASARQSWEETFGRTRADGRKYNGFHHDMGVRESYFATLGLAASATLHDVKTAYRAMVKQRHPDQGGTVQDFLQLQEAYEYLLTEVF
jgi:DnaJ-domain-containing protein 1